MAKAKSSEKALTGRQRAFAIALASGKTRAEAYAEAYPRARNWTPSARNSAACRLLSQDRVSQAYAEELERVEEETRRQGNWTREKAIAKRLAMLDEVEREIERRKKAIQAEAETLKRAPPLTMTPGEIVTRICQILQKSVLSNGIVSGYASICDALDKLAGFVKDDPEAQAAVVVFNNTEPPE